MALGGRVRLPRYVPLLLLFSCALVASKPQEHRHKHKQERHEHKHKEQQRPNPDCSARTCGGKSRRNYPIATSCLKTAMTNCHGGHHGFGNQFALLIAHYAWALQKGVPFCPTRWTGMEHLPDGSQMFDFVGGPSYGPPAAFHTAASWDHGVSIRLLDEQTVSDIRSFYFKAQKPETVQAHQFRGSANQATFVWHIRGADVTPPDTEFVIAGLKTLKNRYGTKMQSVDFISCGLPQYYQNITKFCTDRLGIKCNMLLRHKCNEYDSPGQQQVDELKEDFHRMVTADVMVYGLSTLSICAAVLNSGVSHLDTDLAAGNMTHQSLMAKGLSVEASLARACAVVPLAEQQ